MGRTINLENSVLIYESSSYLPLRELGHVLDVDVDWNEKERSVILTSPQVVTEGPSSSTSGNVQYPAEIKFHNIINYKITIDNRDYYVLANEQNDIIYFRKSGTMNMKFYSVVQMRNSM